MLMKPISDTLIRDLLDDLRLHDTARDPELRARFRNAIAYDLEMIIREVLGGVTSAVPTDPNSGSKGGEEGDTGKQLASG